MKKKIDLSSFLKQNKDKKGKDVKEKQETQKKEESDMIKQVKKIETEEKNETKPKSDKEFYHTDDILNEKKVLKKDVSKEKNDFISNEKEFVTFKLNDEEYGIDSDFVRQIVKFKEPLDIGLKSDIYFGILNEKSGFLPLIDLRKKFGLEIKKRTENGSIIIISIDEIRIGLYTDKLIGIMRLKDTDIKSIPPFLPENRINYVEGVGIFESEKREKRIVIILNYLNLFTSKEIKELKKIPEIYK